MSKRVVVTGLGVVSSIGIGIDAFWRNLIEGRSGISRIRSFDSSDHPTHFGGEIHDFVPEQYIDHRYLKFISRGTQLAYTATKLAYEDAGLEDLFIRNVKTAFCLGTTLGELPALEKLDREWISQGSLATDRNRVFQFPTTNMASFVALRFNITGPVRIFSTACSAGNYSIGFGYDLIQTGEADIVFAGGADAFSWIPFTGFNSFHSVAPEKCQPFDKNRKGMMVGEGGGIVVLESLESAKARSAKIYSEILGYGMSCDGYHATRTQEDGIYHCMKDALTIANILEDQVGYICAHGTGTVQNDMAESRAIRSLFNSRAASIPVSSIKSMLGHTMGAASAIEAVACCKTVQENIIPPTINYETPDPECGIFCVGNTSLKQQVDIALNNGFAFGGNNASLVVGKFSEN